MTVSATKSLGKVYTYPQNPRVAKSAIAAAYNGVGDLEQVMITFGKDNKSPEFLAKFPLGKVPAFESPDGKFVLYESRAILNYGACACALLLAGLDSRLVRSPLPARWGACLGLRSAAPAALDARHK